MQVLPFVVSLAAAVAIAPALAAAPRGGRPRARELPRRAAAVPARRADRRGGVRRARPAGAAGRPTSTRATCPVAAAFLVAGVAFLGPRSTTRSAARRAAGAATARRRCAATSRPGALKAVGHARPRAAGSPRAGRRRRRACSRRSSSSWRRTSSTCSTCARAARSRRSCCSASASSIGEGSLDLLGDLGLFVAPDPRRRRSTTCASGRCSATPARTSSAPSPACGSCSTLDTTGLAVAAALLVLVTVYGEFRSITALVERTPGLRHLDSIGRVHRA